jgi:hypothetical protein
VAESKAGDEQRVTVRREFSKQASNFERSDSLFRHGGILGWIAGTSRCRPALRAARGDDGITVTQRWLLLGG